jgi:ubiquinone/menaquinone biosynthesis C-methylase UbiE
MAVVDNAHRRLVDPTPVEEYWNRHTVNSVPFESAADSATYLEWRFDQYPLFRELMDLWGRHEGETLLDYGCGPGDDTTGFLLNTGAARVVAVDISEKALSLTRSRLALHGIGPERYDLLRISDVETELPLEDGSVDYLHCGGVIQHTTSPERVLSELARTLRPGGRGRIMVYNRESVYFHLYTAYERRILNGLFADLSADEAFARNTDGPECPVSRAFRPAEFCELARSAGFEIEFLGGYFADVELNLWRTIARQAKKDRRLAREHRKFLRQVRDDADGYPRIDRHYAGVGGAYAVRKPVNLGDGAAS